MKRILLTLAALGTALTMQAKVVLPGIFGDNMVLQQQSEAQFWGKAAPGKKVTIRPSWSTQGITANVGKDGRWRAAGPTPEAGGPYTIELSDGERLTLRDVLIGEVWLCSGQSNMEMPVRGFNNQPVEGSADAIMRAKAATPIRLCTVNRATARTPQEECTARWQQHTPEAVAATSATAYFFARSLQEVLEVPVGVIVTCWGGTPVETWMDRETMSAFKEFDLSFLDGEARIEKPEMKPCGLYNAMIAPLVPYTIKGFLWYQGESNVGGHAVYAERLANMVKLWRGLWGQGELPFYFVEIAPFNYWGSDLAAFLREAQCRAQALIPGSGMVSTNDLVLPCEEGNIHPRDKRSVGKRLAFWALNRTYGRKDVACENMQFRSMEVRDGKAYLSFDNTFGGFGRAFDLRGFEVCGADRMFRPAQVHFEGNERLIVFLPDIPEPVAVRYGFRDFQPGNVVNTRELPLVPFRTDDF